ncbi:MAG TPA: hypothetical protein IAD03_10585, partial [Candidatus Caccousia stercoris]|nr:hypothetical protein [Candidatus Caccousia stercoris]
MERGEMTFPEAGAAQQPGEESGETASQSQAVPDTMSPPDGSAPSGQNSTPQEAAEQTAGMFMGRGGSRGGFGGGGQGGGMVPPGMQDAAGAAGSGNPLLLAVTFAGAGLCVLLAVLWLRRRMQRGRAK